MAYFEYPLGTVKYSAFVWNPARCLWEDAPFPVPPVIALRGDSIDNNLIVSGYIESSDPTGPMKTARLFVLRPGSSDWDERRIPEELDRATQIAAVRLG